MIQLKLTYEQFQDLFNALFEAEKSLERLAIDAKRSGVTWLFEDADQESCKYKELLSFITENQEVF